MRTTTLVGINSRTNNVYEIKLNWTTLRLVAATLLLMGVGAMAGQFLFWATERPPYEKVVSIDPALEPLEVLVDLADLRFADPLDPSRRLMSVDLGPAQSSSLMESATRSPDPQRGASAHSAIRILETLDLARPVRSWTGLMKFEDQFRPRLALLEMAWERRSDRPVVNPIQGFMYVGGRWTGVMGEYRWNLFNWVDGHWLGTLYVPDTYYGYRMLRHFPYLEPGSDSSSPIPLPEFLPSYQVLCIAVGMLATVVVWPVAASRALTVRPSSGKTPAPAKELEGQLLSINDPDERWKMVRVGDGEYAAEWRMSDQTWQGLFGRNGLGNSLTVQVALDKRRRLVKVVEQGHRLRTNGRWHRDADVEVRRKAVVRLDLLGWRNAAFNGGETPSSDDENARRPPAYDVTGIKQEIMKTALEAGWAYQPAMFVRWS